MHASELASTRAASEFATWKQSCQYTENSPDMLCNTLLSLTLRRGTSILDLSQDLLITQHDSDSCEIPSRLLTAIIDACSVFILSSRFSDASLDCLLTALSRPSCGLRRIASKALVAASATAASEGKGALVQPIFVDKVDRSVSALIAGQAAHAGGLPHDTTLCLPSPRPPHFFLSPITFALPSHLRPHLTFGGACPPSQPSVSTPWTPSAAS
jgi:hypothetical protein